LSSTGPRKSLFGKSQNAKKKPSFPAGAVFDYFIGALAKAIKLLSVRLVSITEIYLTGIRGS
jgi:hypothetical protein